MPGAGVMPTMEALQNESSLKAACAKYDEELLLLYQKFGWTEMRYNKLAGMGRAKPAGIRQLKDFAARSKYFHITPPHDMVRLKKTKSEPPTKHPAAQSQQRLPQSQSGMPHCRLRISLGWPSVGCQYTAAPRLPHLKILST